MGTAKTRYDRLKKAGLCTVCGKEKTTNGHIRCKECKAKASLATKVWTHKDRQRYLEQTRKISKKTKRTLKQFVINAYGGKCSCCGETILAFLSIDHVNNDGNIERKELGFIGTSFYAYLKRIGCPQDGRYQVLCMNCQFGKKCNGGICPHKQ